MLSGVRVLHAGGKYTALGMFLETSVHAYEISTHKFGFRFSLRNLRFKNTVYLACELLKEAIEYIETSNYSINELHLIKF